MWGKDISIAISGKEKTDAALIVLIYNIIIFFFHIKSENKINTCSQ